MSELISATDASSDSNKVVCRVNGVDGKVPGALHKAVGKKVKRKSFFFFLPKMLTISSSSLPLL